MRPLGASGGFLKREGRPYDEEILVASCGPCLRPLFPKDYHSETQVIIHLISYDHSNKGDSLAGLAASAAIAVSDIPFNGPMSEVRVARIDGAFVVNPTVEQLETADMDMMIGGTAESIVMVEGEMDEVSEQEMLEAIKVAHEAIKKQIDAQLASLLRLRRARRSGNTATRRTMKHSRPKFMPSPSTKYIM